MLITKNNLLFVENIFPNYVNIGYGIYFDINRVKITD